MKIIITDDQTQRYRRLTDALSQIDVDRNAVDIVCCAQDAREKLETERYDLLILDVLIPLRPEGEPDTRHSLDLLLELHEGDVLNRPSHILGITADKKLVGEAANYFEERTWTVVEYSESNDEWVNRAINCVRYIQNEKVKNSSGKMSYNVDLAIICALEKPEKEEVLRLPWNWSSPRPLDDIVFVQDGFFDIGARRVTVCATSSPRMGMVSTAIRSAAIISHLRPRLLAMCGICAGVRGKVNIGDVILADPAWDFQSGKRVSDKGNTSFSIAPHQLCTPTVVRAHVEQIRGDKAALRSVVDNFVDPPSESLRVVIGPLASGSAVLADGEVINDIKAQHRELVGVEMEAYGMYAAAYGASSPQPRCFALKSVCDYADTEKKDVHQRYAAYTSANVLRILMEKFGLRLLE